MAIQEQNMRMHLGPRALQFLVMGYLKNKLMKKKFIKEGFSQKIIEFLHQYNVVEEDPLNKVKVFMIAKTILKADDI